APDGLREKCRKAFDDIRRWQAYAVTLPLPDLIWRLMNETGYYIIAGTFPGGAERQANLRLLADRAREYAEVLVQSFSNVDLDLYIYDENGHLIASDSSYRSDAYVCFVPRWTGVFKVVVKNRSSRFVGDYKLTTN
ncbi:MAG: hypothetical protein IJL80_01245, partial [Treponema sp.]|nr:hypothetical protein [Treponema sp.]